MILKNILARSSSSVLRIILQCSRDMGGAYHFTLGERKHPSFFTVAAWVSFRNIPSETCAFLYYKCKKLPPLPPSSETEAVYGAWGINRLWVHLSRLTYCQEYGMQSCRRLATFLTCHCNTGIGWPNIIQNSISPSNEFSSLIFTV